MKRTEIKYHRRGQYIIIEGVNNVATLDEIKDEFGEDAARLYSETSSYYQLKNNNVEIVGPKVKTTLNYVRDFVRIPAFVWTSVDKERFSQYIALMKDAGENLRKSIEAAKDHQKPETKTIYI